MHQVGDYVKSIACICKITEVNVVAERYTVKTFVLNLENIPFQVFEGYLYFRQMGNFGLEITEEEKLLCLEALLEQ